MLVALALGLAVGTGLFAFATLACAFVIGVLWVLESFEPASRSQLYLTIATKDAEKLRPNIEHALHRKGVSYKMRGSAPGEFAL